MTEKIEYSCLMAPFPGDWSKAVAEMQRKISPADLLKAPDDPHVTVFYGFHTNDPGEVFEHMRKNGGARPISFKIGELGLFRQRDEDVLKLGIESQDLKHLNGVVRRMPSTVTYPNYDPHSTVAILKPGTGDKYLGVQNSLQGRQTTVTGLHFSTPDNKISYVPLKPPTVSEVIALGQEGFSYKDLIEMTTAMAVGTQARPFGRVRPIFPSLLAKAGSSRPSVSSAGSRAPGLREMGEPLEDKPEHPHVAIMDGLEGYGWEHIRDEPVHAVFRHELHPGVEVRVVRQPGHPMWHVSDSSGVHSGSDYADLSELLSGYDPEEPHHEL